MTGTINGVRYDKGFGFIAGDDRKAYFFHMSAVDHTSGVGFHDLERGDRVSFEPTESERGPRAEDVSLLPAPSEQLEAMKDRLEEVNA